MPTVEAICEFLEQLAPPRLAEEWDNVGLLVGDASGPVGRVMTCLTITLPVAAEAIDRGAGLIVAHHPLPFRPLKRVTTESVIGRILLDLIGAKIGVYSPHTAFDSASGGINQRLAEGLGLADVRPLVCREGEEGAGRLGRLEGPVALSDLADRVKRFLHVEHVQWVGDPQRPVNTVAVACGAAGEFLDAAIEAGCDAMLVGESRYHTCLEAESRGIGLILPGHYASERFAVEYLAGMLGGKFPGLEVWASEVEYDPIRWG
jgi:dinuclear metal center YbgI/SA1388 family protein